MAQGKKEEAEQKKNEVAAFAARLAELEDLEAKTATELTGVMMVSKSNVA